MRIEHQSQPHYHFGPAGVSERVRTVLRVNAEEKKGSVHLLLTLETVRFGSKAPAGPRIAVNEPQDGLCSANDFTT